MSIKILAGDWEAGTRCAFNPAIFGRPDRLAIGWPFGVEYTAKEIASIEIVTEHNQTSIMGKVGWGALGGIALGPLGLLAGVLGGGNRHLKVVALELINGKRALIQCDAKSYAEIIRLGFKGRPEQPAQDIPPTRQLSGPPRKPPAFERPETVQHVASVPVPDFMRHVKIEMPERKR